MASRGLVQGKGITLSAGGAAAELAEAAPEAGASAGGALSAGAGAGAGAAQARPPRPPAGKAH